MTLSGETHRKQPPAPPHSHLSDVPATASTGHAVTSSGRMPADCATSTTETTPLARARAATSATGVIRPLFEWTWVSTTAATSRSSSRAQLSSRSGAPRTTSNRRPSRSSPASAKPTEGNASADTSTTLRPAGKTMPLRKRETAPEMLGCGHQSSAFPPSRSATAARNSAMLPSHASQIRAGCSRHGRT